MKCEDRRKGGHATAQNISHCSLIVEVQFHEFVVDNVAMKQIFLRVVSSHQVLPYTAPTVKEFVQCHTFYMYDTHVQPTVIAHVYMNDFPNDGYVQAETWRK
jgi:hypothetical protein